MGCFTSIRVFIAFFFWACEDLLSLVLGSIKSRCLRLRVCIYVFWLAMFTLFLPCFDDCILVFGFGARARCFVTSDARGLYWPFVSRMMYARNL